METFVNESKRVKITEFHKNGPSSQKTANFTENVTAVKSWTRFVNKRSRCHLGANCCGPKKPCIRQGSILDESIHSREGWQVVHVAFCQITLDGTLVSHTNVIYNSATKSFIYLFIIEIVHGVQYYKEIERNRKRERQKVQSTVCSTEKLRWHDNALFIVLQTQCLTYL